MIKYYRVRKDTFLWKEGAILESEDDTGYRPVEDIWDNTPVNGHEYISSPIIEDKNNSEWFERVYKDTAVNSLYRTSEQLKETYKDSFKGQVSIFN